MVRFVLILAATAVFAQFWFLRAEAKDTGTFFGEQRRHHARDMHDAEAVLKGKPQADWTDQESEKYLFNALFTVYFGLLEYLHENNSHPSSIAALDSSGIFSSDEWPRNPYNNWEPMSWGEASSGFSAGNMVIQLCPPQLYSGLKVAPHPMTFTLGVYGANEDYKPINPPFALFDWDAVPTDAVFITGTRFSTTEEMRKKKEALEKRRLAEEKAAAEKAEAQKAEAEKQQGEM